jgi:superfamily II DNA/RNA helicase
MQKFRKRRIQLLVATDVAARGLDVDDLTHVINYGLPDDTENYTHRSGRTGRAGKRGTSIAIINLREKGRMREIEKVIGKEFVKGSIPTGMRIVFKAKGSVSNPKLINVETQEQLLISKDLVAEEEIEINTIIGSKRVRGRIGETSPFTNYFVYKTLDSTWIQLAVGKNLFRYDADEGLDNLEVFVYFQNKFLEVQECN